MRDIAHRPSRAAGIIDLDFAFLTVQIREICEKRARAVAAIGEQAALELERRLADIEACSDVAELEALCGDDLQVVASHRRALHLADGIRMMFTSGHTKPRLTRTGATDWGKVTRLRIDAIGKADE